MSRDGEPQDGEAADEEKGVRKGVEERGKERDRERYIKERAPVAEDQARRKREKSSYKLGVQRRPRDGLSEGDSAKRGGRARTGDCVGGQSRREEDASASVARVIITDFPDLILRTVTRHNSLTQIAHERM